MAIETHSNIRYTSGEKIDVYSPADHADWPIIVILHGGGLRKEDVSILANALAGQGVVVFAPEYLSYPPPPDKIMTGVEEVACAIRFARVYGPDYGGNPNRIIVVGHSGGGSFGAVAALAGDQFHGDCLVTGESAIPDMFIGLDGAYDILRYVPEEKLRLAPPEEWIMFSPFTYIRDSTSPKDLPFHLFVGKEIELLQNAQAFQDALQQAGFHASLTQFPGIDHMYIASGNHKNTVWAIVSLINQLH